MSYFIDNEEEFWKAVRRFTRSCKFRKPVVLKPPYRSDTKKCFKLPRSRWHNRYMPATLTLNYHIITHHA